jgi:hypothetical protein
MCLQRFYNVYCVSCICYMLVIRVTWLACAISYGSLSSCFCISLLGLGLGRGVPYSVHSYIVSICFPFFFGALHLFFCNYEIVLPDIFVFCHGSWVFWLSYSYEVVLLTAFSKWLPASLVRWWVGLGWASVPLYVSCFPHTGTSVLILAGYDSLRFL